MEEAKKIYSQTFIPYYENSTVKLTFVSEVNEFKNIFGEFIVFCSKSDLKVKNFVKNNKKKFFQLKNNYTGEKEISMILQKLDGTPPKFLSNKISITLVTRSKKIFAKEPDFVTVNSYVVRGMQDLNQYSLLNPVYINVKILTTSSEIIRPQLTSINSKLLA